MSFSLLLTFLYKLFISWFKSPIRVWTLNLSDASFSIISIFWFEICFYFWLEMNFKLSSYCFKLSISLSNRVFKDSMSYYFVFDFPINFLKLLEEYLLSSFSYRDSLAFSSPWWIIFSKCSISFLNPYTLNLHSVWYFLTYFLLFSISSNSYDFVSAESWILVRVWNRFCILNVISVGLSQLLTFELVKS